MKPQSKLEKEKVRIFIQNYEQLTPFINNIQASYVWFYNSLDVMVRKHKTPSIGSVTDAKPKNQVRQEVEKYLEQLRQDATREDLELNAHNM